MTEYGYVRIGTAVPRVRVANVSHNIQSMSTLACAGGEQQCDVLLFPELCITGYTCADLFQQTTLLSAAQEGLDSFLQETRGNPALIAAGLPVVRNGQLYNCAAVMHRGALLGIVPKTFIPGYKEYYEPRWFTSGDATGVGTVNICGRVVPFGADLLFQADADAAFCVGVEICEDLWAPIPPSCRLALGGAHILLNLSASNDLVGKAAYRNELVRQQSARCLAAYAYCSAGVGESSTDLVFGGQCSVAENGTVLVENERFRRREDLVTADVDVHFLEHERIRSVTFGQAVREYGAAPPEFRRLAFASDDARPLPADLRRPLDPHPFVPAGAAALEGRCREIFAIQSNALATRLEHTGLKSVVLGLSGGLDSTLALLVVVEAFRDLDLELGGIHCYTLPGFGTSERTRGNVERLCRELDLPLESVDIREVCQLQLRDLGHSGAPEDVAYENVQARQRTQFLMNKANMLQGMVIGTGDLSELALGWCTYNGDHMSMYAVNAGVPKTLVRFIVRYVADHWAEQNAADVLHDIVDTPITPELLPPDKSGEIAQITEDVIGPYELQDFFLYNTVRCGFPPEKTYALANRAFADTYSATEIRRWQGVFYRRFFSQQFKRSCLPDGPKVGTVALSPRGDWRMPSDASVDEWLNRLERIPSAPDSEPGE